jgi:hypothetical protein
LSQKTLYDFRPFHHLKETCHKVSERRISGVFAPETTSQTMEFDFPNVEWSDHQDENGGSEEVQPFTQKDLAVRPVKPSTAFGNSFKVLRDFKAVVRPAVQEQVIGSNIFFLFAL